MTKAELDAIAARCRVCLLDKPITEFYVRSETGKRRGECKPCRSAATVRRDRGNPKIRAYKTEWARNNPRSPHRATPEEARASYLRHLPKYRARQRVHSALRNGSLVKPSVCSRCERTLPPRQIHAHHPDYSKPLKVEWLCSRCHGLRHIKGVL